MNDAEAIALALEEAKSAAARGEVPVGAVLLSADGSLLAKDGNRTLELKDPTAHAEMLAMRAGAKVLGNERLIGSTLYVSLEPCAMCAGAMAMARIGRLVFAACDPKGGAVLHGPRFFEQPTCHHRPGEQTEPHAFEAGEILKFFACGALKTSVSKTTPAKTGKPRSTARRDQSDAGTDQHVAEEMRGQQRARHCQNPRWQPDRPPVGQTQVKITATQQMVSVAGGRL
jgi:tRNA(Arg) A34 adenosine deaminase TadA